MLKSARTRFLSHSFRFLAAPALAPIAAYALSASYAILRSPTTCWFGLAASLTNPPLPRERSLVLMRMCVREVRSAKAHMWATLWKQKRHAWDVALKPITSATLATLTLGRASTWARG